jgi:hypothetical protein
MFLINKIHANSVVFRESKWYLYQYVVQNLMSHSCTPGNSGKILSAWFYYTISMLYDLAVLTISTVYLLRYNPLSGRCAYPLPW